MPEFPLKWMNFPLSFLTSSRTSVSVQDPFSEVSDPAFQKRTASLPPSAPYQQGLNMPEMMMRMQYDAKDPFAGMRKSKWSTKIIKVPPRFFKIRLLTKNTHTQSHDFIFFTMTNSPAMGNAWKTWRKKLKVQEVFYLSKKMVHSFCFSLHFMYSPTG